MESLLLIVTVVSLALGAAMSIVAWRLLRDNRDRSAARVEALQVLARVTDTDSAPADSTPASTSTLAPALAPPMRAEEPPQPSWDVALHPTEARRAARELAALASFATESPAPAVRIAAQAPVRRDMIRHIEPTHDLIASSAIFTSDAAPATGRRTLALAVAGLVMVLGAGAVYAARTWDLFGAIANAAAAPRETQPLELLSLRHATDEAGSFTVTGLVQNPHTGRQLRGVVAVIYVFDQQGRFLASGRAALEVTSFQPGDESPFIVKVPAAGGVTRYRVGFRLDDGGVVAHVDRRGQLPDGTMEDAIEHGQGAPPMPAQLGPRGSEG
jgi:hypothetical protein